VHKNILEEFEAPDQVEEFWAGFAATLKLLFIRSYALMVDAFSTE
jgi:hypothetical protein